VAFLGRTTCTVSGTKSLKLLFLEWLPSLLGVPLAPGARVDKAFFLMDDARDDGAVWLVGANSLSCTCSRRLDRDPDEPGRWAWYLLREPGESSSSGEGRGVMSLMAASAGELRPEAGDRDGCELKLMVDSVDLGAGRARLLSESCEKRLSSVGRYTAEGKELRAAGACTEGERTWKTGTAPSTEVERLAGAATGEATGGQAGFRAGQAAGWGGADSKWSWDSLACFPGCG
jgi:hypothetical protein